MKSRELFVQFRNENGELVGSPFKVPIGTTALDLVSLVGSFNTQQVSRASLIFMS